MLKDDARLWAMLHGLMDAYFDGAFCGCCAGLGGDWEPIMRTGGGFGAFAGAGQGLGWLVEWPQVCGGRVLLGLAGAGASHRIARLAWVVVAGETGSLSCAQGEGWRGCRSGLRTLGLVGGGTGVLGESLVGACRGWGLSQDCRSGMGRYVWDVLAVWDGVERHRGAVWARPGTGVSAGGAPRRGAGRGGENGRENGPRSSPAKHAREQPALNETRATHAAK